MIETCQVTPDDADGVVAPRADRPGHVGAVAVVVVRVVVARIADEVPAVDVVDLAVAVVVDDRSAISPGFDQMFAARSGWL